METHKSSAKKLLPHQEDFIEVETHCCLCGTELMFEHVHDDEAVKIKEKAGCPTCKITLKEKVFLVH